MKRRHLQLHAPRFDLRQIEDVVDQRQQMAPGGKNVVDIFILLLVQLAEEFFQQHFREADDRVERRAQLVRHVGEKLRLVPVGRFDLPVLVADLAEQPRVMDRQSRLCRESLQQIHHFRFELADLPPPTVRPPMICCSRKIGTVSSER